MPLVFLQVAIAALVVSLHHFATDACLWKLRQPQVQERLV